MSVPEPVPTPPEAIPLWFSYSMVVEGTDILLTVRWYLTDALEAEPVHVEVHRVSLMDPAVTPERVRQEVYDRAVQIRQAVVRWQALDAAFGAGQGVKVPVP